MRHSFLTLPSGLCFAILLLAQSPYQKWLDEDVAYIITDGEREAFQHLSTHTEREQFIEQFWRRRDATPGTMERRREHYRRIAYANEFFSAGVPGWKTDRGHVYIVFGPPDEIESHPQIAHGNFPYEAWRYRHIEGVGDNITIEFVDVGVTGEYRLTLEPTDKRLTGGISQGRTLIEANWRDAFANLVARPPGPAVAVHDGKATISVPLGGASSTVYGRITDDRRRVVAVFEEAVVRGPMYRKSIALPEGSYHLGLVLKDQAGPAKQHDIAFEVKYRE